MWLSSNHSELHYRGHLVNHRKVYRLMKKLGISCIKFSHKSCKYQSYKGTVGTVAKNRMNRRFNTPYPYQKLKTNVTEFKSIVIELYKTGRSVKDLSRKYGVLEVIIHKWIKQISPIASIDDTAITLEGIKRMK